MDDDRQRCWSAILFALAWPVPTYVFVGSALITVNEQLLGAHVFDASSWAAASALASMLAAAAYSERQAHGADASSPLSLRSGRRGTMGA
jgi:hypothetical protein